MMTLDKLFRELDLVNIDGGEVDSFLDSRNINTFFTRNFVVANASEMTVFVKTLTHPDIGLPIQVPVGLPTQITYRTNTNLFTDCHQESAELNAAPEYVFLFTSDCWKLREMYSDLGPNPPLLDLLLESPENLNRAIRESNWEFSPGALDQRPSRAIALSVLLWSTKAFLLRFPDAGEFDLEAHVRRTAAKLGLSGPEAAVEAEELYPANAR